VISTSQADEICPKMLYAGRGNFGRGKAVFNIPDCEDIDYYRESEKRRAESGAST
jgi:hypothetical protein